jgi:hypothetical protein
MNEPTAWIDEECYPSGFPWADPSKIRKHQVFCLLDHWRKRQQAGLAPLIWNPSCELISGIGQQSRHVRNQKPIDGDSSSDSNSDDEDFAAQLANITEDGTEPYNYLRASPSPHSTPSRSGALEPEEQDEVDLRSLSSGATPHIPHISCEFQPVHSCNLMYFLTASTSSIFK